MKNALHSMNLLMVIAGIGIFLSIAPPTKAEDKLTEGLRLYQLQHYPQAAKILVPLAEAGELQAVAPVLYMYRNGFDTVNGVGEVTKWQKLQTVLAYQKSNPTAKIEELVSKHQAAIKAKAESGEAWAQYAFGQILDKSGSEPNAASLAWYRKAAEQSYNLGLVQAGISLLGGDNPTEGTEIDEQDKEEALRYFLEAAHQGDPTATYRAGTLLYTFYAGREIDKMDGIAWLEKAAAMGHVSAMIDMAGYYLDVKPVIVDKTLALYQKLIELKVVIAYQKLGDMYAYGQGVPQNFKKAAEYYQKAADEYNFGGYRKTAEMYLGNILVVNFTGQEKIYSGAASPNSTKALEWLAKTGNVGDVTSMTKLCQIYSSQSKLSNSKGVVGNNPGKNARQKAIEWCQKTASADSPIGFYLLGKLYDDIDDNANFAKAGSYYRVAAERGMADAQYEYGRFLANALEGQKNLVDALMWIQLALSGTLYDSNNTQEMVQKTYDQVAASLSPEEQQMAKRLALKCNSNNFKNCGRGKAQLR